MSTAPSDHPLLILVGMPGAGKSIVADHLRRLGWPVVYFGGITLKELDRRGLPHSEQNERLVREQLREIHGKGAYAQLSLPEIRSFLLSGPTAIDGLYSWAEYLCIKASITNPLYVCTIYTSRALRYARLATRGVRPLNPTEAEARDIAEIEKLDKGGPIAVADFTLINDGTENELLVSLESLLQRIAPGPTQRSGPGTKELT